VQEHFNFQFFLTVGHCRSYKWTFFINFCQSNWNFVIWRSPNQSSPNSQDRAGPSDLQSFSESIKSKFNAVSMRYQFVGNIWQFDNIDMFDEFLLLYAHELIFICFSFPDIKSRFQRVLGDGKRDFSLAILPWQI
jgi:hypothetical protein